MRTLIKIIGVVVVLFIIGCIWDNASSSYHTSKYKKQREEYYNREAAKARSQYPTIRNWSEHPLYTATITFLVQTIDYFIQKAKVTTIGRDGGFRLTATVYPERVYLGTNFEGYDFYYSQAGYDRIKVGYTERETTDACNDFAVALSNYLKKYYSSREAIDVSDVNYFIDEEGYFDTSVTFSIDLRKLHPRLKQV